jgi:hypothetical protein
VRAGVAFVLATDLLEHRPYLGTCGHAQRLTKWSSHNVADGVGTLAHSYNVREPDELIHRTGWIARGKVAAHESHEESLIKPGRDGQVLECQPFGSRDSALYELDNIHPAAAQLARVDRTLLSEINVTIGRKFQPRGQTRAVVRNALGQCRREASRLQIGRRAGRRERLDDSEPKQRIGVNDRSPVARRPVSDHEARAAVCFDELAERAFARDAHGLRLARLVFAIAPHLSPVVETDPDPTVRSAL